MNTAYSALQSAAPSVVSAIPALLFRIAAQLGPQPRFRQRQTFSFGRGHLHLWCFVCADQVETVIVVRERAGRLCAWKPWPGTFAEAVCHYRQQTADRQIAERQPEHAGGTPS